MAMRAGDGPRQPDFSALDRMAGMKASSLTVTKGKDGDLEASASGTMAFRSGVNRVFGRGKSEDDVAANKATLNALLDHIEAKTSKVVRDRVLGGEIRLKGDDQVLTVKQRLERGTYVSSELVAQLKALAEKEVGKQAGVQTGNQSVTREFMGGEGGARELVARLAKEDDRHPRAWAEIGRQVSGGGPLARELDAHLQAYAEDATSRGRQVSEGDLHSVAGGFLKDKLGVVVKETNRRFAEAALADGESMAGTIRDNWFSTKDPKEPRDVRVLADQIARGGMVGPPGPDQRSVDDLLESARANVAAGLKTENSGDGVPAELSGRDVVWMLYKDAFPPLLDKSRQQRERTEQKVGENAATFHDLAALAGKEPSQAKIAAKDGDRLAVQAQDIVKNLLPAPDHLGGELNSSLNVALPALDAFAKMQDKLDKLAAKYGPNVPPNERHEVLLMARGIASALPALEKAADMLQKPPHAGSTTIPPLSEVGAALGGAAKQIQATLAKLPLD